MSVWLPGTGMPYLASIRLIRNHEAMSGMLPTNNAAMMVWPASIFMMPAIASGPGWGMTRLWVMTPPEQIAIKYRT